MNRFYGRILEDRSAVVQGRLVKKDKTLAAQADMASITYRVVRLDTGAEIVSSTALVVADVVFNTPFDWDVSREPGNFRHVIAHTVFTVGGISYEIQYTFTFTDGTVGGAVVEPEAVDMVGV